MRFVASAASCKYTLKAEGNAFVANAEVATAGRSANDAFAKVADADAIQKKAEAAVKAADAAAAAKAAVQDVAAAKAAARKDAIGPTGAAVDAPRDATTTVPTQTPKVLLAPADGNESNHVCNATYCPQPGYRQHTSEMARKVVASGLRGEDAVYSNMLRKTLVGDPNPIICWWHV